MYQKVQEYNLKYELAPDNLTMWPKPFSYLKALLSLGYPHSQAGAPYMPQAHIIAS